MCRRLLFTLFLFVFSMNHPMQSQELEKTASGHYLFAWTGDASVFADTATDDGEEVFATFFCDQGCALTLTAGRW